MLFIAAATVLTLLKLPPILVLIAVIFSSNNLPCKALSGLSVSVDVKLFLISE
jgi:hypothetical protein